MARRHPGFKPKPLHVHKPLQFPEGFLWGSATSSHQVEGWNDNNDWWEWEHLPGTIADGQLSGRAADHYHRFKSDFNTAKKLGQNIHRLSIEWSRIFPSIGEINEAEVQHYIEVLQDLKDKGIKTMVTLHHFTIPIWFAKIGGFEKRSNLKYFNDYVEHIVPKISHLVDFWITINEPNIYCLMAYLTGLWPPGKKSKLAAFKVFNNLARAHKDAYTTIHEKVASSHPQVGVANNITSFYAYDRHSLRQWFTVRIGDWLWNHWFIEKTKGYHDFIGINYYVHQRVKKQRGKGFLDIFMPTSQEGRELSDLDWEIFPPGFFDALVDLNHYHIPIYITENGLATLNEDQRSRYIVSYLKELYHAIESGVDVRGYLHWSLLDNFEWDKGLEARFGLIHVDFKTLKRTVKPSAKVYGQICKENAISHDLLRFIGHNEQA